MGSVPRLHQSSSHLLKFSGFVEHNELIVLVIKYCRDFHLNFNHIGEERNKQLRNRQTMITQ